MIRKGNNKEREQAPEGTHLARIVGITDLGHQPGFEWQGKKIDPKWKVELTFELVDAEMKDGRPFHVSKEYNNTDNDGGNLYAISQAIGKSIYEPTTWINAPCMVQYTPNSNGKLDVASVAGVPASIPVGELRNESWLFQWCNNEDALEGYQALHRRQNKIKEALNLKETKLYTDLLAAGELDGESDAEY